MDTSYERKCHQVGFQDHLASFQTVGMGVLAFQMDPEETKRNDSSDCEKSN